VLIAWLFGIEFRGAEEAPGCHGSVGEEVQAALAEEAAEEEEDLRGANSVVGEAAEVGGADMCAPSPGNFTWAMTAASQGYKWTNKDVMYAVSMETWWYDVFAMTVLMFYVLLS